MGLREKYNSHNPDLELIPRSGWWEMRLRSSTPEIALSIAVLFHANLGWGYWDRDENEKPVWVAIDVPEKDPRKLHTVINYYEMGRTMAYLTGKEMTAERALELIRHNCQQDEERKLCLQGMQAVRMERGWEPIEWIKKK